MPLHIVCLLKPTLPTEARIALNAVGKATDERAKPIINPYDEFGIEEAVQLKEKGVAASVTIVSVCPAKELDPIYRGLAMGADKAIVIDTEGVAVSDLDGATTAAALAAAIKGIPCDLVFCGRLAVDTGAGEVPGRLSDLLGWPLLHVLNKVEVAPGKVVGYRDADGRTEVIETPTPCICSADKALNKPRYPNLPSIMQAKKKPIEHKKLAELVPGGADTRTRKAAAHLLPPAKGPVKMIAGGAGDAARSLVVALRDEAKVLR